MIRYTTGNLLDSDAQAIVNTVNTDGVMGKGIALQFKKRFPLNYKAYVKACKSGECRIGRMFITEEERSDFMEHRYIINFPTKTTWRKPSEYVYIEEGLRQLVCDIKRLGITSIAIPPLGAGNGQLDWQRVKTMIESQLAEVDCDVIIYEPNSTMVFSEEKGEQELTPARAMLLDVICDMVAYGEFASEFASEKIAYFLQRFGGKSVFNLEFKPAYYGPYSGKVRHVLNHLDGTYLQGVAQCQRPFDYFWITSKTRPGAFEFLSRPENAEYKEIAELTKDFLAGYYSNRSLEILSTIDYLRQQNPNLTQEEISIELAHWSNRKDQLFNTPELINDAMSVLDSLKPYSL